MCQNVSPASNTRGSDEVSTLFYCGVLRGKSVGGGGGVADAYFYIHIRMCVSWCVLLVLSCQHCAVCECWDDSGVGI